MEDEHFWHWARNHWILHALKSRHCVTHSSFLEVGCGAGAVARAAVEERYDYTGVDTAKILIQKASERITKANFI